MQSIGAIALDPKNSKNVWVGTGESWTRNSVSIGNGMYTLDRWRRNLDAERFAELGTHCENHCEPGKQRNGVYVAVPGPLWSDSPERGLYKTTDGGRTWNQILKGANLSTGCSTIAMDPTNPNVLLAGMWDFRRQGWTFRSGGNGPEAPSGSGLFRTTDGGATWKEITPENSKGFPKKPYGRLAVAIAPSNAQRVYCFVESTDSALFVSDDGGATWDKRDKSTWMVWRPFYFAHLTVDPKNPDRVFKTDGALIMSEDARQELRDGGRIPGCARRCARCLDRPDQSADRHRRGRRRHVVFLQRREQVVERRTTCRISQFYHVSVDDADPYRVYGGLQDNSSWVGQSQYPGGITNAQWENMYGGDGFWMFADPADPDYLYAEYQGGYIARDESQDPPGPRHSAEAELQGKAALELEYADRAFADRKGDHLHWLAVPFPLPQSRPDMGPHFARPDDERSREAEAGTIGRRHGRQFRGRDAHHDLLDQRVAQGQERHLGRHR